MLKGHIFSSQLYSNNIAALVNNVFANAKNGVFKNFKNEMDITYTDHSVTINSGACLIQGRPLEEDSSTTLDAGIETAFCKLVVEIDLSRTNTEIDFEQGLYNIVKSSNTYPDLTQEDIIGDAGKYQFELARFKISGGEITEFEDRRVFIESEKDKKYMSSAAVTAVVTGNDGIDITATAAYQTKKVPFNNIYPVGIGAEKFSLVNGEIVVGEGVSEILINGNLEVQGSLGAYGIIFWLNGLKCGEAYEYPKSQNFDGISLTSKTLKVKQGDVISLAIYINNNGDTKTIRPNSTYLSVQAVC